MKYRDFRDFKIIRNCNKEYKTAESYKKYLAEDFKHRCAYCNMSDSLLDFSFEIDHFIPSKVFKGVREELAYDYNNLIYSCKKCNDSKSDQYSGNILDGSYSNNYFYNPVEIDFNRIFYRNEYGGISSEDIKGKEMISKLGLYYHTYNLAFILEELNDLLLIIKQKIKCSHEDKEQDYYYNIYFRLNEYFRILRSLMKATYWKRNSFTKELKEKIDKELLEV